MPVPPVVDKVVKTLIQGSPEVFLKLGDFNVAVSDIHAVDTAINLTESRADHVFRIGKLHSRSVWALLLEYQLYPKQKLVREWLYKKYALQKQLDMPVMLVAFYLRRGRSRSFPSSDILVRGSLTNQSEFSTIHLWMHLERIRSGELAELAPLLPLCVERPTRRILEEGRHLIRSAGFPLRKEIDLMALSAAIGTRYLTAQIVQEVFREDMEMIKSASFIEEWMSEREERGKIEGVTLGRTEGLAEGRTDEARVLARILLAERFGSVPEVLAERIQDGDEAWCRLLLARLVNAASMDDLNSLLT